MDDFWLDLVTAKYLDGYYFRTYLGTSKSEWNEKVGALILLINNNPKQIGCEY
jgi:hypothetical protein